MPDQATPLAQDDAQESPSAPFDAHLAGLFTLAQVITASPDEAARLVEETFRRARLKGLLVESAEPGTAEQVRVALYRLLLELRSQDASGAPGPSSDDMRDVKTRLAVRVVDASLPTAFAALPAVERILLLLCDVQNMSCGEAGRVLDLDADTASARLDAGRTRLEQEVRAGASPAERELVDTALTGRWRHDGLRRMVEQELTAVPPTLYPSVAARGDAAAATDVHRERRGADRGTVRAIRRALTVVLIVAVAGLLGYGFSRMTRQTPDVNLITISAQQADAIEVAFETTSPEQAERFIQDRLGRRITVPSIDGAALEGIAIRDVAEGAEAPVLLYQIASPETGQIVVYVYSYAFLDEHAEALELSSDVLGQIETEGNFDLHDLGESTALIFRRSDDIYIAVTAAGTDGLRDRISFPS